MVGSSKDGSGNNNNNNGHDHSKVSKPAYEPANPLQVINWMSQAARKYSTISIPGVYGASYDQFPLGQLFNRDSKSEWASALLKNITSNCFI